MRIWACVLAMGLCGVGWGQEPPKPPAPKPPAVPIVGKIVWPVFPPVPVPDTTAPIKLNASQRYVLSSDTPLLVEGYGVGQVSVQLKKGPLTMPVATAIGWKPDPGDKDFVTVPGPNVYLVKAEVSGAMTLRVQSAVNKLDAKGKPIPFTDKDVTRKEFILDAGIAPIPPPVPPDPPKPPTPPPTPAPIPVDGFRVMIVYETSKLGELPASQVSVITSVKIREYLNSKCVKGPDGKTPEARFFDPDTVVTTESKLWQDALKRPRGALPTILISDGKTGYEGPLPLTVDDTLKLLQKYGG